MKNILYKESIVHIKHALAESIGKCNIMKLI